MREEIVLFKLFCNYDVRKTLKSNKIAKEELKGLFYYKVSLMFDTIVRIKRYRPESYRPESSYKF